MIRSLGQRWPSLHLKPFAMATFMMNLTFFNEIQTARAVEDSYGGLEYYFQLDRAEIAPDHCVVEATINYDNVMLHMAKIRNDWLSKAKSTEFYQHLTLKIIYGVVDHKAGGVLLQMVYQKSKERNPDKCHFTLHLAKNDDFGQIKSFPQLSWDFTAALASRVVWERFDDRNLSKIVLNYKFTQEADRLQEEKNRGSVSLSTAYIPNRPRSCADIIALDVAEAFGNSPYARSRHLTVLDATNPKPLPQRANREFACISKLVTNGGTLNVFVEPKLLNGKWYVSVEKIP